MGVLEAGHLDWMMAGGLMRFSDETERGVSCDFRVAVAERARDEASKYSTGHGVLKRKARHGKHTMKDLEYW
jgi:hypothetical protein